MKNKSTLKRLMAFCRPYRIYLVGALLFSTINKFLNNIFLKLLSNKNI